MSTFPKAPIPAELGNLANLQLLYLHGNQLNGSIPAELSNLTNLERLHLQSNQLNGFIPAALGNLTNLQYLSVSNNQLNGPIPAALGNLANLQELYLQSNQLTGPIPTELGDLINLTQLRLNKNQLSGPIPLSFTNLTSLTQFYFHNTYLCTPDEAAFEDWLGGVEQHSNIEVRCPSTSLLAIYALALDSDPTSPANLSPLLYETMQSIVEATAGSTDRAALVLADQDGAADTNIFMVLRLLYSKVLISTQVHHPSRFTGSRVMRTGRTCPFRLTFPPRAFLHPDVATTGMAIEAP